MIAKNPSMSYHESILIYLSVKKSTNMKEKLIFIVDDDEMMTQMLRDHLLRNPMHKVSTFATGEECIEQLAEKPDVVILDYKLNLVKRDAADGLEILQRIKKFDKDICVIMLSSQKQYSKAAQTIMKGALEYVVKDEKSFKSIDAILASGG